MIVRIIWFISACYMTQGTSIMIPIYDQGEDKSCNHNKGCALESSVTRYNLHSAQKSRSPSRCKFYEKLYSITIDYGYVDEELGLNGFIIEAQNITLKSFTLTYIGLTAFRIWNLNVQWLAIQDQTVYVHYVCLQPTIQKFQFQYTFNQTQKWFNDPIGALFITGQNRTNTHSQDTYIMGASLTSISKTSFTYSFLYKTTDYLMCIHSIFAPSQILKIYPFATSNTSPTNITLIGEYWCQFPAFAPLDQNNRSSIPMSGFNSYQQRVNESLRIFINLNVSIWIQEQFNNSFLRGYLCENSAQIFQVEIMRIQYVPLVCSSITHANTITGQFCQCFTGYYFSDYTSCDQCHDQCLTCLQSADLCTSCGTNAQLYQNSCYCNPGTYREQGADCLECDQSCTECQNQNLCTSCQKGYFMDQALCHKCDKSCLTCLHDSTHCQTCKSNAFLDDKNQCKCNQGYYRDTDNNCEECERSCYNCTGPLNSQCTECSEDKNFINNYCVCSEGQYIDEQGKCQDCSEECATCDDDSSCLTCKPNLDNYYSEGQCLSCKEKAAMTVDICNYADCTDEVWTKGEQCDDGNDIDRDGCSDCQIDTNYKCINVLLQESFCYTCPQGCLLCTLTTQNQVICNQCQKGYYIQNNQCSLCNKNCVTCSTFNICLTCLISGFIPNSNGSCPQCEDTPGLHTIGDKCQTRCGDSVIAGYEECDDGNLLNGDGCSLSCSLEYGYILQDGKPYQIPIPNFIVNYVNATALTNFSISTGQGDSNICYSIKVLIENFDIQDYNYTITVSFNQLTQLVSCSLSFNFNKSLNSSQLIHFQIPYTVQSSRRLLDYYYREVIITPRSVIVYSQSQVAQAQSVQSTSSTFTLILYFVGPGTVILGGFECFFRILDILAWINNLYFINIQYPLNVGVFFQNSGWASVQLIPQFMQFNQPGDPYYTESPRKFMDLGVDPLFINNAYQSLSIILLIITCHILSRIICLILQLFIRPIETKKLIRLSKLNIAKQRVLLIWKTITMFNLNIISHLIKGLNLAFLDLVLAIIMQILYFQSNYLEYTPVLISTVLALLSNILICYIIKLSVNVSNKHYKQLQAKTYEIKYGVLFQDINKQSKLALKYSVFNLLRKTFFIVNLIVFYNIPLFQTAFSFIISLMNISLILYENPFENRKALISNAIPDSCIFGLMLISFLLAADDEVINQKILKISQLTAEMRFQLGWVMLALIALSILVQLLYVFESFIERLMN